MPLGWLHVQLLKVESRTIVGGIIYNILTQRDSKEIHVFAAAVVVIVIEGIELFSDWYGHTINYLMSTLEAMSK